ncbi:MAG: hypothetical protein ACRD2Z_02310 [Thermoanaerobaculia bacterium]
MRSYGDRLELPYLGTSSRRLATVGLGIALMVACVTDPRLPGELRRRVDEIWRFGGVDPGDVQVFGYAPWIRPRSPRCADLPEEDRWWANQASKLPSDKIAGATLLANWERELRHQGYELRRFRSTASEGRILVAVHADDGVYMEAFVETDGNTTLDVMMGPCATRQISEPDPPYIPEA